jgi:tripartite-type tricarboxylate transporter receptor subunit TctC
MIQFRHYLFQYLFQFVGAALAVGVVSLVASAQADLIQPLRIIVPCAVGSPTDFVARLLAKEMLEKTGQQAFVENFTAGSGPIGIETVKKMLADDRSMLFKLGDC